MYTFKEFWLPQLKDKTFSSHEKVPLSPFEINHHPQSWPQTITAPLSGAIH